MINITINDDRRVEIEVKGNGHEVLCQYAITMLEIGKAVHLLHQDLQTPHEFNEDQREVLTKAFEIGLDGGSAKDFGNFLMRRMVETLGEEFAALQCFDDEEPETEERTADDN